MQKKFYEYMKEGGDLSSFESACDALIKSKYILADRAISNLLIAVAESRLLYDFFADAAKGFDVGAKLAEFTVSGEDSDSIAYPVDYKEFVSLVLGLLYMFDARKLELNAFLRHYYADIDGIGESYQRFLFEAVVPFKKLVIEQARARQ